MTKTALRIYEYNDEVPGLEMSSNITFMLYV